MKKNYFLSLGIFAFSTAAISQSVMKPQSDVNQNFISDKVIEITNANPNTRATQFCSDTNLWAWGRSFDQTGNPTYYAAFLHGEPSVPVSYGTYVNVPSGTSINVHGFGLYARSIRPDGASVSVNAVIYAAGVDSLPTGMPIRTITLTLDTTSSNFLSDWEQKAIFNTPATFTSSFVISIESSTTLGDSIEIIRGFTGSGVADNFPVVYQADGIAGGAYFSDKGGAFGARLPHFYPYVSFSQTSTFATSISQLSGPNENVDLTYTAYSIQNHPVWSINGFVGLSSINYSIDGGSTFFSSATGDTTVTIVDQTVNHSIVMHDSIMMWSNPTCLITETITLLAASPNSVKDATSTHFSAFVVNGNLTITQSIGNATLYSITGRMVKQMVVSSNSQTFDVSDLQEGVYILQVGENVTKLKL